LAGSDGSSTSSGVTYNAWHITSHNKINKQKTNPPGSFINLLASMAKRCDI